MSLSGGRESKLIKEVEELKSKLIAKTDEFNEAIKRNSEVFLCSENLIDNDHSCMSA